MTLLDVTVGRWCALLRLVRLERGIPRFYARGPIGPWASWYADWTCRSFRLYVHLEKKSVCDR